MQRIILIFTFVFLFALPNLVSGQKQDINIGIGWGVFQGININTNFFYRENLCLGMGIGSHFGMRPLEDTEHFSLTLENRFHFGNSLEGNLNPWVFGQQVVYWSQSLGNETWRIISIAPTFGVNLAFSKRIIMFFDIGPGLNLVVDIDRPPMAPQAGWMWPILINFRGQLIYRF